MEGLSGIFRLLPYVGIDYFLAVDEPAKRQEGPHKKFGVPGIAGENGKDFDSRDLYLAVEPSHSFEAWKQLLLAGRQRFRIVPMFPGVLITELCSFGTMGCRHITSFHETPKSRSPFQFPL